MLTWLKKAWSWIRIHAIWAALAVAVAAGTLWRLAVGREKAANVRADNEAGRADGNARSAERERALAALLRQAREAADARHAELEAEAAAIAAERDAARASAAAAAAKDREEVAKTGTSAGVANDWLNRRGQQ